MIGIMSPCAKKEGFHDCERDRWWFVDGTVGIDTGCDARLTGTVAGLTTAGLEYWAFCMSWVIKPKSLSRLITDDHTESDLHSYVSAISLTNYRKSLLK